MYCKICKKNVVVVYVRTEQHTFDGKCKECNTVLKPYKK